MGAKVSASVLKAWGGVPWGLHAVLTQGRDFVGGVGLAPGLVNPEGRLQVWLMLQTAQNRST